MTSPAQSCTLCGLFANRSQIACVRAWFVVHVTPMLAIRTPLCSSCYESAKGFGDLVPGAEVEVL